MTKKITLTFSKTDVDSFNIDNVKTAQNFLSKKLDHWHVLENLHFTDFFSDDGNEFMMFEAIIKGKKIDHIINNITKLYFHWSYILQHGDNDCYYQVKNWSLNIEVNK